MNTAIILSGQTRTFARCLPSLAWLVFPKFENPHFFASVAKDDDAKDIELLRQRYPDAPVSIEVVEQPTLDEPPLHLADHAPYAITPTRTPGVGPLQGIMRQLWHNSRAYRFAMENGAGACDVFVRCRPDLHVHRFESETIKRTYEFSDGPKGVTGHMDLTSREALTPWWGRYGPGCNDRFAVMGNDAAKAYFETYDNLPAMLADGIPFHPETLVGMAVKRAGCWLRYTLDAEFAMRRKDGSLVHMQVMPQELAEWTAYLSRR